MIKANTEKDMTKRNAFEIIFLIISLLGFASVVTMGRVYWTTDILSEGWPNFTFGYLVRSGVIAISTITLFLSLFGNILFKKNLNGVRLNFALNTRKKLSLEYLSIVGLLIISTFFLLLFIVDATTFSRQSLEDSPLEWASSLFLFACAIIFATAFTKSFHSLVIPKPIKLSMLVLAIGFFFVSMEEISWLQRVLDIQTPKAFQGNGQHEMNLHNFKTDILENLYYFGAFLYLVVLPFMRYLLPQLSNNHFSNIFIARPFIGIIGAIACAYNFDMWNIMFTQIAFVGSLLILSTLAIFSIHKRDRYIILLTIFMMIITQMIFLLNGEKFARLWEVTEYKEFIIALVYLIYSFNVYSHISKAYLVEHS